MYEVAWREINARFEFVIKRKSFKSSDARAQFCRKIMEKSSFDCFLGFRDHVVNPLVVFD